MIQTIFAIIVLAVTSVACSDDKSVLRSDLEPLQFLVGACWAGQFPDGERTDMHCYESVYRGVHLRDRHVVTGGSTLYQGETIYSWSEDTGEITYVYWNSLGGVSTGSATPRIETIVFPDESYQGANGETVTISSVWENITADGYDSLSVEVFQNGEKTERRVRYEKRPFVQNPLDAK